jgi:hypothetical protein
MYEVNNLIGYDVETYPNYFLVGFKFPTGEVYQYGFTEFDISQIHGLREFINWVEQSAFNLSSFNGNGYDDPVLSTFLESPSVDTSYQTSVALIEQGVKTWMFNRDIVSIDLMQVMPKRMSLKKAGVCMRHKKLEELPYDPHSPLTPEKMAHIATYNINDLDITQELGIELEDELQLRHELSNEYGVDLRSKGRATCAELILCSVMASKTGLKKATLKNIARENVEKSPVFNVQPAFWFKDLPVNRYPTLQCVIDKGNEIFNRRIHVMNYQLTKGCLESTIFIGDRWYNMGIGGLHSMDGAGAWESDSNFTLMDVDVTSYYPALMLTQGYSPRHWIIEGVDYFRETFKAIVDERVAAKKTDPPKAKRLKIVINGTFGKTNDPFSALYDPYIMASVTVTGQIALIALVAMVHDVGGNVISANTDGITIKYPTDLGPTIEAVVTEWETLTKLDMEYCEYTGFYQKDVNNYIAVPTEGSLKTKGVFNIPAMGEIDMEHTPTAQIVSRAVKDRLETNKDMVLSITECKDIQEFLYTQNASKKFNVTWRGQRLDNMVRFYKSLGGTEILKTPKEGGTSELLSKSEGVTPLPNLPDSFATINDINYEWYIQEANKLFATVTRPKVEGLNKIAKEFESNGLTPAIIKIGKPNRKNPESGELDFSSMLDDETFAVATGRHYGVICQRMLTGETYFYQVDRKYKSTTRKKVMNDHGFEFIFGSNIEAVAGSVLHQIDQDWLEQFYTPSELTNARKVK